MKKETKMEMLTFITVDKEFITASGNRETVMYARIYYTGGFVKTENGSYYEIPDGVNAVNQMSFVNTYTKTH